MALTHVNKKGDVIMVDVSGKEVVARTAVAGATVTMSPATVRLVRTGSLKKGDCLACARVAGIMAAKKTPDLIPLCHPLGIEQAGIEFVLRRGAIDIRATVRCTARTGVEMEALTAAAVAALSIYDMCKAADKAMVISDVRLISKRKGAAA